MNIENELPALEKTERGLEWVDPEGNRHTFQRAIRTLRLHVSDLQVLLQLDRYQNDEPLDKPFKVSLMGQATVDDRGIQQIGSPETHSKAIKVQLYPLPDEMQDWVLEDPGNGSIRQTVMGYSEADWEIGNESEWYAQSYLPAAQLNEIISAVKARSVSGLTMGIDCPDLYVTEWYAPPAAKVDWYMAPERHGARGFGRIEYLSLELTPVSLRPIYEDTELPEQASELPPLHSNKAAYGVDPLLAKHLEKAASVLRWVPAMLFFIGIAILLK